MPATKIDIRQFLGLSASLPILDVRSPAEYAKAHIPGALNLPLFSDEERRVVGTAYKQESRRKAIQLGLDYFGPKMRPMVLQVEEWLAAHYAQGQSDNRQTGPLLLHCWRGGMRSGAVAWLLDMYGFKVYTLTGGYKAFRHWVLQQMAVPWPLRIIGGYTGSGKTLVLQKLRERGEKVIDLEQLANHKGSAFGNIGLPPQPGQEMFENRLAWQLKELGNQAADNKLRPIWVEDESQRIGDINLPNPFWQSMRKAPVLFFDIPFAERLDHIIVEYGQLDRQRMAEAITRIRKRLGPLETKTALEHLQQGDIRACFAILLAYYDKFYKRGLLNRANPEDQINLITCPTVQAQANADRLVSENLSV